MANSPQHKPEAPNLAPGLQEPLIEAQDVSVRFGAHTVLTGARVTVRAGEIVTLIGPNGAGKTTAFRVVYGLLNPDSGAARVDGIDVAVDRMLAQRQLGVLPDVRGLYPRLTAREHIRYFGQLHGSSGAALESDIDELIERLGMTCFCGSCGQGFFAGSGIEGRTGSRLGASP